ncbi:MAG: pilus assembly protein [Armatimonadetes bacterium]|nr:pilus assembly protein [Armatimonadota bacterium]
MLATRRRRGQALIETTMVSGFLVILVLGIIGLGSILQASVKLQSAAREGARVATMGGTNLDVRDAVLKNLTRSGNVADVRGPVAIGINPAEESARVFNTDVTVEVWWRYPIPVALFNLLVKERELYAWKTMIVTVGDPGTNDDDGTGGTGGSSACNALVNDGADIPEVAQTGTPPTMTGGSVTDGTYVLTSRKDWQGSCGCTTRQKITVSGGKIQLVTRTDSKPDQHMSATATFASNKLSLAVDCPTAAKQEHTYTATATELQIFSASDQALSVYTKK